MKKVKLKTKIFLDGGDPRETRRAKELLGFLDGQTTNPSLIARRLKNPKSKIQNPKLTEKEALEAYKETVREMAKIIPSGSISIQVFANARTSAEEMLGQARERVGWIPNASIKFPCTREGLRAVEVASREMPVNITLVFSQAQAAAVYSATREAKYPVFVSPFVGRLDDRGENGMDVVRNIIRMYRERSGKLEIGSVSDKSEKSKNQDIKKSHLSHIQVLTASVRNLDHLMYALYLGSDIVTLPFNILEEWAAKDFKLPEKNYKYNERGLKPIPYENSVKLGLPWQSYDLSHPLTDAGVGKFWDDWRNIVN